LKRAISSSNGPQEGNSNMKKLMIVALAGALAGGIVTSAQARGGGMGRAGGIGTAGTNFAARPSTTFHQRAPAVSTTCNLNPGYLYHPCF
jgi:hypothetical protein